MKNEHDIALEIEQLGSKVLKLLNKNAVEHKPKADRLLTTFGKWLDKKLSEPSR